jgi:cystathionine gamma-lyase/homocysteine desulfhydrase
MKKATQAVHAGTHREFNFGGVNTPVFHSSAIEYLDDSEVRYPRYFNTHNNRVVAEKIAALENAEAALVTSSGMAAISIILYGLLQPGDHVVFLEGLYGGTHSMICKEFTRLGIGYSFVAADPAAFEAAVQPNSRMLFIESPTNPLLTVLDLAGRCSGQTAWPVCRDRRHLRQPHPAESAGPRFRHRHAQRHQVPQRPQ